MPPRTAKKLPPGPGAKRGGRGGRGAARAQAQAQAQAQPEVEEPVKAEETRALEVVKADINVEEEVTEYKTLPPAQIVAEPIKQAGVVQSVENTMVSVRSECLFS